MTPEHRVPPGYCWGHVGLWAQNVGVRSMKLPECIASVADPEGEWLPEAPDGTWVWATLRQILALADLDRLTV